MIPKRTFQAEREREMQSSSGSKKVRCGSQGDWDEELVGALRAERFAQLSTNC